MKDLKTRALKGLSWSFIDNIFNSGITFLLGIVLARLIEPKEFGLIGMITVFVNISIVFIDGGFYTALVRKRNTVREDFNTVFITNLLIGVIVYSLFFVAAPSISVFFKEPRLIPISRVVGLVLIINAFSIVQRAILTKSIDFKTQAKISLLSSVISGLIGITLAFFNYGVWSLVFQTLTRQLLQGVLLWYLSKWRPVFEFSVNSFQELFRFGSRNLVSNLLDKVYRSIYYVVIGRFYSAVELGNYTRAEQFNSIFSNNLTAIIQRVSFPSFSLIQDDNERLRLAFSRVLKSMMLLSFTLMLGLAAVAKPLILILIGSKWTFCIDYLQIICFSGILFPLNAINMNLLDVKGRSDLFLKLEIVTKLISIPHILIGIYFGIEFMLWGGVVTTTIVFFVKSYYSSQLLGYSSLNQIRDITPSFLIAFFIASIVWSITLLELSSGYTLAIQIFLGVILFFFIHEHCKLKEYMEIRTILLKVRKT